MMPILRHQGIGEEISSNKNLFQEHIWDESCQKGSMSAFFARKSSQEDSALGFLAGIF